MATNNRYFAFLITSFIVCCLASVSLQAQQNEPLPFDHAGTGFELDGAHAFVACESCHRGGRFAGTPRQCFACHSNNGLVNATPKSLDHVATTDACETCHNDNAWEEILRVDHTQVIGSCGTCHNGTTSEGKPPNHIVTTAECNACHSDFGWVPAAFNHDNVVGGCSSCHNGSTATGKHATHLLTNSECDLCHSTITWTPATFDHSNVTGTCSSCHNGSTATGKDMNHIVTAAECDVCHSTIAWIPASFDHSTVTDNCSSCHNGSTATGMDAQHFQTSRECNECHTTVAWTPDIFSHTYANYPGEHRGNLSCDDCHGNNAEPVTWPFPAYQPDCAGCHANDYRIGSHKKVDSPAIFYQVSELKNCAGACHEYTDATFTTIRRTRNGEHRVNANEF